ncbi:MAG: Flp pilus assembly complex ATPase component TadA [Phycisphaerales bacterium]|nr:MAG: Flp pilus assembly complex ATPase component TadA [Phycisphaerales bacterium]
MARQRKKLGEILQEWGTVSDSQIQQALGIAKGSGKRLGEALVEAGFCKEEDIAKALAAQFDMEFINLGGGEVTDAIDMSSVPEDLVKKHLILPLGKVDGRLKLVIHDPMDLELLDLLRFRLNCEIDTAIASKGAIKSYIDGMAGPGGGASIFSEESLVTESVDVSMDTSVDTSVDIAAGEDAPIIRLAHRVITEAVRNRASDIHIEPMEDRVLLRYRIDGVCHVRDNLPKRMQSAMLARFKLMSGVNIAERRIPQDGRIKMPVDGELIDFRVSSCPAYHGESIVLRILRPESVKIGLENLGFEPDNLAEFNKIIRRPNGIFLVTGPTGSGKTTTLYSALDVLNRPDRKIITAEDPVEYNFTGMNQCQVRENIGLTFASILRAMLRQAPNIILVGEIRDHEVAEIGIQAALTGHLVFSTLHTNDAPSAITRLIDMGVKPFLVSSSIQAVMAQRLFRLLCERCRERDPDPESRLMQLMRINDEEVDKGNVCRPKGCGHCGDTGFRGRKAIFELMRMNPELRELAFNQATIGAIRDAAVRAGMRDLVGDGKIKILRGDTCASEIVRFAQAENLMESNIDI